MGKTRKKKNFSSPIGRVLAGVSRKTIIVTLIIVLALGGVLYLYKDKFSASGGGEPINALKKCQSNLKDGCQAYFKAKDKKDGKSFLAKASSKDKERWNGIMLQAKTVTNIALKTKDLNQCWTMQEVCHNAKKDYDQLLKGELKHNIAIVNEKPKTKPSTDDSKKFKECKDNLASVIKQQKSREKVVDNSIGNKDEKISGKYQEIYDSMGYPSADMDIAAKEVGKTKNVNLCLNVLGAARDTSKDYTELMAAASSAEVDIAAEALRKAERNFNINRGILIGSVAAAAVIIGAMVVLPAGAATVVPGTAGLTTQGAIQITRTAAQKAAQKAIELFAKKGAQNVAKAGVKKAVKRGIRRAARGAVPKRLQTAPLGEVLKYMQAAGIGY